MAPGRLRLTLLARAYCSLCDAMAAATRPVAAAHDAVIDVVDVDAHPLLEAAWGEQVPVLFLGPPDAAHALCHYHFDAARVAAALAAAADRCRDAVVADTPEIR